MPIFIAVNSNVYAESEVFRISTIQQIEHFHETAKIVIKAYKNIGIEASIINMPAKRALLEAEYNEGIDAELGRVAEAIEELPHHIMLPVPLITISTYSYATHEFTHLSDWQSLKQYKVVTLRGFVGLIRKLEQKGLSIKLVDTTVQAFELVKAKRVDMAILPEMLVENMLESEVYSHIKRSDTLLITTPVYHFIHEKHKDLIPELTKSLEKLLKQPKAG